jgi:hypothetical protein
MEYQVIVSAESLQDLINKVNEEIGQGWTPQGGVSMTSHVFTDLGTKPTLIYAQAIAKE